MNTPQNTAPAQNPVKRTFWFGMIWTIPAALYVFGYVLDVLIVRADTYTNFIRPASGEEVIRLLAMLLEGDRYFYLAITLDAITVITMIGLSWRAGFITRERLKFWRVLKGYPSRLPGLMANLLGRLVVVILLVYFAYDQSNIVTNVLPIQAYPLLFSSFDGLYEYAVLWCVLMLPLLPLAFAVSSLIYAVMSSSSVKEFAVKGLVSVIGLLILLSTCTTINMVAGYLDLDKYIDGIPGVTLRESPRSIMALSGNTMHISICDNYYDCMASSSFDRDVPVTDENSKAVRSYLESRDYMTGLRSVGFSFMAINEIRKLDIYGAVVLYLESLERTGDELPGLFAMQRIKNAPANERYRALLDDLTDEYRFSIEGSSALMLSKAFAKFGDLEKARHWYAKGISTGSDLSDRAREIYEVPDVAPFNSGRVSGVLTLEGKQLAAQPIGIAIRRIDKNFSRLLDKESKLSPYFDLNSVVDGTATDSEGRFSFAGLGEEEYVLLLSLEDIPGKKYHVVNSPGPISVSEDNPSVNVGTIELVLVDEDNG